MTGKRSQWGIILDFNRTLYNPETQALEEGARDLLTFIHENALPCCLLSKKTSEERASLIEHLGITPYFVKILFIDGSKSTTHFCECLDAMKIPPHHVLVVGDRVREEIRVGNELGMKTIWYRAGKFASELPSSPLEQPFLTVTTLREVITFLSPLLQED